MLSQEQEPQFNAREEKLSTRPPPSESADTSIHNMLFSQNDAEIAVRNAGDPLSLCAQLWHCSWTSVSEM
jgi:hypothetical protein